MSPKFRLVVALFLAAAITPIVYSDFPEYPSEPKTLAKLVLDETAIGLIYGFCARAIVFTLEKAGVITGQLVSISQVFGAQSIQLPVFSHFFVVTGLAVAFSSGVTTLLINIYTQSYTLFPIERFNAAGTLAQLATQASEFVWQTGYALVAIFMTFMLVMNASMGFVNRALPQLMVSFVTTPFVSWATIVILWQYGDEIMEAWRNKSFSSLTRLFQK